MPGHRALHRISRGNASRVEWPYFAARGADGVEPAVPLPAIGRPFDADCAQDNSLSVFSRPRQIVSRHTQANVRPILDGGLEGLRPISLRQFHNDL